MRPGSLLQTIEDVDTAGVRIVAKERSAYDLWLTEHIAAAEIVRTSGIEQSFAEWRDGGHEVLAGLRPKLLDEAARRPGSRILPGSFTVIGQVGILEFLNLDIDTVMKDYINRLIIHMHNV